MHINEFIETFENSFRVIEKSMEDGFELIKNAGDKKKLVKDLDDICEILQDRINYMNKWAENKTFNSLLRRVVAFKAICMQIEETKTKDDYEDIINKINNKRKEMTEQVH